MTYIVDIKGNHCVCFASIEDKFKIKSLLSLKDTNEYLEFLSGEEKFDYKVSQETPKGPIWVECDFKTYHRPYRVLLGNLLKGMNEHKAIIDINSNKAFFDASYESMLALIDRANENMRLRKERKACDTTWSLNKDIKYGESHQWWRFNFDYPNEVYTIRPDSRGKTKTVKDLFAVYYEKYKGNDKIMYDIWDRHLRRGKYK